MIDARHMGAALALAERGRGRTAPNPNVGCVIVLPAPAAPGTRVIGRGWTQPGGRPHAEAMALEQAGDAARGAIAYVTLEPCAHASERGPACADLLIEAGVARVVAALRDPDSRTNGAGVARMQAAGMTVTQGVGAEGARRTMAGFLARRALGRPHVTLKLALSLDGRIATAEGSSRWITGEAARAHAHLERSQHEAIVVGRGTYEADAPGLDVRLAGLEERSPARYILSRLRPNNGWGWLATPQAIAAIAGDYVLVEGGAGAAAAFLAADLVDRLLIYTAPIVIGDGRAAIGDLGLANLADAHARWCRTDSRQLGSDRLDVYDRQRS